MEEIIYGSNSESIRNLSNSELADLLFRVYRDNRYVLTPYECSVLEVVIGRLQIAKTPNLDGKEESL